ncbi:MAG TPA: YlzJ-like family protein [Neobacillus sp.]|jgi:hypothetical protein
MILYTMMPQELIFPNEADAYSNQMTITYQGIPLLVERTEQKNFQVVRILSSDPNHFMDDRLCPGAKISFFDKEGLSALE